MHKVLAFGEVLWDMIEGIPHLGGAPLNFAAHVRKSGLPSGIVTCIGNDALGERAMAGVETLGIATDLILRRNKKTGMVRVQLVNGQPDYEILKPSAYDYIDSGQLDHDALDTYEIFYFGTLAQRADSSRIALYDILSSHAFREVFYDVNLRKDSYTPANIESSLHHATLFKINDEEVPLVSQMLFDDALNFEAFASKIVAVYEQVHTVIITAGGEGCYIYHKGNMSKIASEPVAVADTVGAGDAFSAAFMVKFLQSNDPLVAAKVANKVGGYVASQSGAIPEYPEELKMLLK